MNVLVSYTTDTTLEGRSSTAVIQYTGVSYCEAMRVMYSTLSLQSYPSLALRSFIMEHCS